MIRLELPWLPPSSNTAYFNLPGKGRALSTDGRRFLTETKMYLARQYPREMMMFRANRPYHMIFCFTFQALENAGFATGKAKTRYKIFDGGNRTKLLEDALKDAGGIDDSQTTASLWCKRQGTPERTTLWAYDQEAEGGPIDELLRTLR